MKSIFLKIMVILNLLVPATQTNSNPATRMIGAAGLTLFYGGLAATLKYNSLTRSVKLEKFPIIAAALLCMAAFRAANLSQTDYPEYFPPGKYLKITSAIHVAFTGIFGLLFAKEAFSRD